MTQYTGMLTEDEFLEHFGKKGMKWGVRKAPEISGATMAIKPKRTDAEKAALRKKIIIGAAATAAALAVVGGIVYVKYDAKTLLNLQSMVARNVSTMGNDISQNPTGDQLLRRGAEFTRRSYGKNSAWANPLRTYVVEGPETDFIKGYGDTVFKFSAARDIKIAGLNTQYDILKGPISGKALRNVSAEQYAKYSLSGRKYINKTLSDDSFAKLTLGELRKSAWDSSEDGSKVASKYANLLKTRGYSAVNDLNFPKSAAKVLLDPSAFARV